MSTKSTDEAIAEGIRRTINRFRENPFYYFTESDIHASLVRDILDGNSDKFYLKIKDTSLRLSMIHLEYPTNFKFSRAQALNEAESSSTDKNIQRGNFDLVVLKESIFNHIAESKKELDSLVSLLKSIISKDIENNESILTELGHPFGELIEYAFEVKFFHFNNASQEMFDQVKIDNFKLDQAIKGGAKIKPVNLIFCYYWNDGIKNQVWEKRLNEFRNHLLHGDIGMDNTPQKLIPQNVLNIFIEANINPVAIKSTKKPACYYKDAKGILPDWVSLLTNGYEIFP